MMSTTYCLFYAIKYLNVRLKLRNLQFNQIIMKAYIISLNVTKMTIVQ